jgi:two-component system response regulator PilR (NtrC family)
LDVPVKILVVDDEPEVRELCQRVLKKEGYIVHLAENGEHALEILRDNKYHVAIVDLKMANVDGMTVLKEIKENYLQTDVIIITGFGTIRSAVEAIQQGAADYLPKPFEIEELNRVVRNCLRRQNLVNRDGSAVE